MAKALHPPPVRSSLLYKLRLRLLKVLLICGSSAIGFLWATEAYAARMSPIDIVAYPLLITIFLASCAILIVWPSGLERIERLTFATFAIYIVLHAQPAALTTMTTYEFASLTQWFPLVYTAAFFFLPTRRAMLVSAMIYLSIVIPYGLDLVLHRAALWDSDRGLLMMNLFCAHPVYIVTLSGIATLKTHIVQAGLQADALRVAASVDYLTGVANRRATTQVLESAFEQACASSIAISVVLLDIDHFKTINDTRGHAVGDTALVQVCTILQQHLRASDVLGRWGGEEFLIVASATSSFEAVQVAERLRAVIATHSFDQVGQVTASFGVATLLPQDTPEALVKRADEALYHAKQSGRNRVELASALASL